MNHDPSWLSIPHNPMKPLQIGSLQIGLVSLALFVLLLIVLFHCCHYYPKLISKIRKKYTNRYKILEDEDDEANDEADRELFSAAEDRENQIIDTY